MTEGDREFLAEVPGIFRFAYPWTKATDDIARDFGVSVHTVRGWLYRNSFPLERKQEFIRIVDRRLDERSAQLKGIERHIIETVFGGIDPRKPLAPEP
jgi:hypothetical protein